jgi:regulator of sirC expression with transglutaminase-like and TPR domain
VEVREAVRETASAVQQAQACAAVLGERHGFAGDRAHYDQPDNSMLHRVLERRRGLPILLCVVYVEVARRAGIPLAGVGLPGHFVVAHFGAAPPPLIDPFAGGAPVEGDVPAGLMRPWSAHETALRMLNNLVSSFARRGRIEEAIRAARLRLALPIPEGERARMVAEARALEARLN